LTAKTKKKLVCFHTVCEKDKVTSEEIKKIAILNYAGLGEKCL
jgi:hypothetical protein